MQNNKKVIVITGGSGHFGKSVIETLLRHGQVINISRSNKLDYEGVDNVKADLSTYFGQLHAIFYLKHKYDRVDVLISAQMFIYRKPLNILSLKEIKKEFDINFFSQVDFITRIKNTFWESYKDRKGDSNLRKLIVVSSAVSVGDSTRPDLESYMLQKKTLNNYIKEISKTYKQDNVSTHLLLPASLSSDWVVSGLNTYIGSILSSEDSKDFELKVIN